MKRIVCISFFLLLFVACSDNTVPQTCDPEIDDCGGNVVPSSPSCEGDECYGEPSSNSPGPGLPSSNSNPGSGSNKLYVEGRQLMLNGQPKVLRGMSLYWYNGPWSGGQPGNNYYTAGTVQKLADPNDWGSNVVRAAIGNVYENTSSALAMAKNMMDWAKNNNIYVIIDNHTHYAHRPAPATAANNFFREVSAHVKNNGYTHVIYEIYNEPLCDNDQTNNISCANNERTSWAQVKTYSQGVINTIRGNDPDGVILVGTPNYAANIHLARQDPITGQKNLMYVLHYYSGESAHNNYKSRLKDAYCANFPIFITEWGASPASGRGTIDEANNRDWMSIVERAKISWANWSLMRSTEAHAALTTDDVSGPTSQGGTIVKNWIKELNAGRSVSGVNPNAVDMGCP